VKVAMLGSGSRGNATLVVAGKTRILVDAGFSGRELAQRLGTLGVAPAEVDAIVLTHEHGDHTRGAGVFARRHGTPLYLTETALAAAPRSLLRGGERTRFYAPGRPFSIGDLEIRPFLTVHDAADPVAVTVTRTTCGTRVGVATDLGRPTAAIRHSLEGCDFLILEANHCETLLRTGSYPPSVQARIASSHGHLSNHAAAAFARELLHPRLAGVLLAHLSAECNRAQLALEVVGAALRKAGWEGWLGVAAQDEPTPLLDIEELRLRNGPAQLSLI
jgi:phosphoribosyl 1,2-cyclic phosphodiesterase